MQVAARLFSVTRTRESTVLIRILLVHSINTNILPDVRNSLPNPLPQPILDQSSKHHQISRISKQFLAELPIHPLSPSVLSRCQQFPLTTYAGNGPQEQGTNITRDGRRKSIEGLGRSADSGDRGLGVQGEKFQGADELVACQYQR